MYSIYADGVCIHSDIFAVDNMKVINPKLTLSDSAAGSLSMTLPSKNIGYNIIERMITDITVEKDGEEIWMGRVLSESKDFWNNRIVYCEGELAFFNDSTQPPNQYSNLSIRGYLEALIAIHNSKVMANRQFQIGVVTVNDDGYPDRFTNYEKTMTLLNGLVETYGGHMRVRKANGVRYLDYLKECPNTCSQTIQMGINLIDFTKSWDSTEFATVIVPLGARLNSSPIKELDAYLTVSDINNGSIYVQSNEAVAAYGWIEKTVQWDDVVDPEVLLEKARLYLSDLQFDNMVLELSAIDMHYLNADTEAVKLLDEIRVISLPHGLDRLFPVTQLEIQLDSPEKTIFKLGDTVQTSLTAVNDQANAAILEKIEALPKAHNILKEARDNATAIMNMATTGFITITKDQYGSDTLYISNTRDYTAASKLWKWNMNGLGYSKDGGETYGLAITMDGAIVADYITTGTMSADRIRTGVLESVPNDAGEKTVVFDLTNGKLTMKKGSIFLGAYDNDSKHYKFEVDEEGNIFAGSGIFAGELAGATGTFAGIVAAEDFRINNEDGTSISMMTEYHKFKSGFLDLYGLSIVKKSNNVETFTISEDGDIYINAKITMAAGSSINWANVSSSNDKWTSTSDIQDMLNGREEGNLKGSFINGSMITSATIIGSKIYWGDNGTYGSLTRGTGSASGTETNIVELYSNDGIVIRANGGGMRLESTKGIWLNNDYAKIYVRYNGSYINLGTLISELTSQ